jgi:hypothetical protein
MKSNFEQWKVFLEARRLQKLTLEFEELFTESGTRYSVEVNFRTNLKEAIDHFSKLVLGYVMASLKQHNYHVKHVYTVKPYRILISTRQWDDGEWVGIVTYNEEHNCFIFTPGVYSKMRGTASYSQTGSKKCMGTSAAEITKEVLNHMEEVKKKPLRDGERLKPINRKRGPSS